MAWLPSNQKLVDAIERLVNAMDDLERRMRARIDDATRWPEDHLDELAGLSSQLARIRAQLRVLQKNTY